MKTLLKIAWRNVWRNKLRSLVVITSIVLGIWAGLFTIGLSYGINEQRTRNVINNTISHIQIHHPEFMVDRNPEYSLMLDSEKIAALENHPEIKFFSERSLFNGMASSTAGGNGVMITGVDPDHERHVTNMWSMVIEGSYFESGKKNEVLIGERLAKKMKVAPGNKIVLTFQDTEGTIVSGAFRITGLYKTASSKYDEVTVFVKNQDLIQLLGSGFGTHEIAILLKNELILEEVKGELSVMLPGKLIEGWREISPELGYADEMMATFLYLFLLIVMFALSFGIINTMLMAVLERKKELGMLMSVGMNKGRVFLMIMFESIFLGLTAGPIGIGLSYPTVAYFQSAGLNLSMWGEGLESFGISSIVYPVVDSQYYVSISILVVLTSILSSIYPARKALKLNPVESLRAI